MLFTSDRFDIDKINKNTFIQIFDMYNIEINFDNIQINQELM